MNWETRFVTVRTPRKLKRAGTTSTKDSNTFHDSSSSSTTFSFPSYHEENWKAYGKWTDSSESHQDDLGSHPSTPLTYDETPPKLPCQVQNELRRKEKIDYTDSIPDKDTKKRTLSLAWDRGNKVASSFRIGLSKNSIVDDVCELPDGLSKFDITVTIDIDEEARSSLAAELGDEELDVEVLEHARYHTGNCSRMESLKQRRKFEDSVAEGILDDLSSVYTAKPEEAKFVLCVLISVLSDGTLDHTFWSGGRVGLTEIIMQFVLFDADDLQVFKRGRVVQKKDFGFGPLGLTENEGQHYLSTILAPRATSEIIRKIGKGSDKDLLAEF